MKLKCTILFSIGFGSFKKAFLFVSNIKPLKNKNFPKKKIRKKYFNSMHSSMLTFLNISKCRKKAHMTSTVIKSPYATTKKAIYTIPSISM